LSQGRETNERWWDAELHRLRAELLLAGGPEAAEAEAALRRALEIARGQQARSLELRAARALAGLWAGSGRTADARDLLAPVYSSFTAGAFTMSFRKREHHDAGAGFVQASQGGLASTFGKTEVEFSQPGRQGDIAATTTGFGAVFSDVPQPISLFAKEEWPIRLHVLLDGSGSMEAALPVAKRAGAATGTRSAAARSSCSPTARTRRRWSMTTSSSISPGAPGS